MICWRTPPLRKNHFSYNLQHSHCKNRHENQNFVGIMLEMNPKSKKEIKEDRRWKIGVAIEIGKIFVQLIVAIMKL